MNHVLEDLRNNEEAKFGVNIPVSEEFIPRRPVSFATWWIASDRHRGRKKCCAIVTSAGDQCHGRCAP